MEDQYSENNSNESAQRRDPNSLALSSEEVENILNVKCNKHPKNEAEFIYLVPDAKNKRICLFCVKKDQISQDKYQDIRKILIGSKMSVFNSYPVLADPQLSWKIQAIMDSIHGQKERIDKYFLELPEQFQTIIQRRKDDYYQKFSQFVPIEKENIARIDEIMKLQKLQSILSENDQVKLDQFIKSHVSNVDLNTSILKGILNQYQTLKNELSEDEKNIKAICEFLNEVNQFHPTDSSLLHGIEDGKNERNPSLKSESNNQKKITQSLNKPFAVENDLLKSSQLVLSKNNIVLAKDLTIDNTQDDKLVLMNNKNSSRFGQAYLNFTLDPKANYVLYIELEQKGGIEKKFWFGLMREEKKDIAWGYYDNLSFTEYNCGLDTQAKDKSILNDDRPHGNRSYEIRINIERKILKVGLLPDYDFVVEANSPEIIDINTPYLFYLAGLSKNSKMSIMKLQTVSQFDYAM